MSSPTPFPGFTEIHAVAERGPKSLPTLRPYIRQGTLQAYKFGSTVYLKNEDLVPRSVAGPARRNGTK
jgi:hypothetical protein